MKRWRVGVLFYIWTDYERGEEPEREGRRGGERGGGGAGVTQRAIEIDYVPLSAFGIIGTILSLLTRQLG